MYNVCAEEEDGEGCAATRQSLENSITMNKMKQLKAKMEDMNLNKKVGSYWIKKCLVDISNLNECRSGHPIIFGKSTLCPSYKIFQAVCFCSMPAVICLYSDIPAYHIHRLKNGCLQPFCIPQIYCAHSFACVCKRMGLLIWLDPTCSMLFFSWLIHASVLQGPKIEILPISFPPVCQWMFLWYFLIHINILEFHGGREFHPMQQNMSLNCLWGFIQVSGRRSSPVCLKTAM